jgi:hypothetical protein
VPLGYFSVLLKPETRKTRMLNKLLTPSRLEHTAEA